ncbi:MAG: hypothetical protein RIM99_02405 [Cyclobacteriaceae bacterium]
MKSGRAILLFFFVTFFLINLLIQGLKNEESGKNLVPEAAPQCTDGFQTINELRDRLHQRDWSLNNPSISFCTSYESVESLSLSLGQKRNRMSIQAMEYADLWGTVYRNLVKDAKPSIAFLTDSLRRVGREKKLSRKGLAEMIVTFVQDIPYSYVLNQPCETFDTKGKPCLGNITLGILTPYEFLHSLYGDCDTRAVLIYTLLEEFGFDPMIVVSNQYAHAMLALNLPATGDHLKYRGNNYYFWETTTKGWPIGMLPPSTNNVSYWDVALVNEL